VLRNNGLSLAMFGFFTLFLAAQSVNGWQVDNAERAELGEPALTFGAYLQSGHFIEATFENWESEFLQMGAYVVLTVFLFQRGSSESKDPDAREEVDDDPQAARQQPDAPWPVRRGNGRRTRPTSGPCSSARSRPARCPRSRASRYARSESPGSG
jgi:hypothetical protein